MALPSAGTESFTETEGTFTIDTSGFSVYTKTWMPSDPPKARLIFVHGFSDHINRYYEFFPTLASRGIAVYGFDQRGWGRTVRSRADRGDSGPTVQVLADIASFLESKMPPEASPSSSSSSSPPPIPVFVMGHSMGGGEVLALATDPAYGPLVARVRGWILESPFLGFEPEARPSWLKEWVGRLVGRFLPRFQLYNPLPPEQISRDPAVVRSVVEDELCHDTGTLGGFIGLLDRTLQLRSGRARLASPPVRAVLVLHGSADVAASFTECAAWWAMQRVDDGAFKQYDGALHQLHADLCKEEFYEDVVAWVLARCGGGAGDVVDVGGPGDVGEMGKAGETGGAGRAGESASPKL